jgi:adenylate cyclase
MSHRCLLVAEILGGARLNERFGPVEATRAIERCLHRISTIVETSRGHLLSADLTGLSAHFERCDIGLHAASEMLERVATLPPSSGVRLDIRIGLHYVAGRKEAEQDVLAMVRSLASMASPGQGFITEAALRLTTPAMRSITRIDTAQRLALPGLEWSVYVLPGRAGPTSMATADPEELTSGSRLEVVFSGGSQILDERHPILLIGREPGNDVVLSDPRASRQHGRLEWRPDGFQWIDRSTNGSYIAFRGQEPRLVHHGALSISGAGRLGCGVLPLDTTSTHLSFRFLKK